ncbi:hypothetical protein Tco_0257617 [Tanacetum coccineum]
MSTLRCCVAWTNECEKRWRVVHLLVRQGSVHPFGEVLTNRWLSMKKDIASCGSKYLAYLEVEVEYQGSSGLLLQPELPE